MLDLQEMVKSILFHNQGGPRMAMFDRFQEPDDPAECCECRGCEHVVPVDDMSERELCSHCEEIRVSEEEADEKLEVMNG